MTKALDYFDPSREYQQSLTKALSNTKCRFLVVSFTTDWRFSPERSQEIVNALITNQKPVSYLDIDAEQGHDSFLFPIPLYVKSLRAFLGGTEHLNSTPKEAL
jgi:homoserine O-acetyltransferase